MNYATLQYLGYKCVGRCFYCGFNPRENAEYKQRLAVEHKTPKSRGGTDEDRNLVLSCRSCNSSKGTKTFEEFRAFCAVREFEKKSGVSFTKKQLDYLRSVDVTLDIPKHEFWNESFFRELSSEDTGLTLEMLEKKEEIEAKILVLNGVHEPIEEIWLDMMDPNSKAGSILEAYRTLHSW